MKNWLIKRLGGYTRDEYLSNRKGFDETVQRMQQEDRLTLLEGPASGVQVIGSLISAPGSTLIGGYFELGDRVAAE